MGRMRRDGPRPDPMEGLFPKDNYFILDEAKRVVCVEMMVWARWFETAERHVKLTVTEDHTISTIFLGLNHQWGKGPPLVFETMIFNKEDGKPSDLDTWQYRYSSWDDAEHGHKAAVRRVLAYEKEQHSADHHQN